MKKRIRLDELRAPEEFRHPPFGEEYRRFFWRLHKVFADVYPRTVQEWEEGFRYEAHPEREMAIWKKIAEVYERDTKNKGFSREKKLAMFRTILAVSMGGMDPDGTIEVEVLEEGGAE